MSEQELKIARKIGTDVSLLKIKIPCPVCLEEDPGEKDNPQFLASIGDREEILFCPHCDLEIRLVVTI